MIGSPNRIARIPRLAALAILFAATLGCSPDVAAAFQSNQSLTLDLNCDPTELCWGDELSVLASCENAGEAVAVDLYLAVALPAGDVFYFPDGTLSAPFISSVIIPGSASFTDVEVFSGEVPSTLEAGEYLWVFAATSPGTGDILGYATAPMKLGSDCWESYSNYNNVTALVVSGSNLIVGTETGGILEYDLMTGRYKRYGMSDGLASSEVSDICVDESGNIIAVHGCGFLRLDEPTGYDDWGGISWQNERGFDSYYPREEDPSISYRFRRGDHLTGVEYSSVDNAAYAISFRYNDKLWILKDGALSEVYIPSLYDPSQLCRHPDGGICVLFQKPYGTTTRSDVWRVDAGSWTRIAGGGDSPILVSSDGIVWSGNYSDGECDAGGLSRLIGGTWESIGLFDDVWVGGIAEGGDKMWVLGYIENENADGSSWRLYALDGDGWSCHDVPPDYRYFSDLTASEDGTVFISTSTGVLRYRESEWSTISFDCPLFGGGYRSSPSGLPSDLGFHQDDVFAIDWPYVSCFDGAQWRILPPLPLPHSGYAFAYQMEGSLLVDSYGRIWTSAGTSFEGQTILTLYRFVEDTWNMIPVLLSESYGRITALAEDSQGGIWLQVLSETGKDSPVVLKDGLREYKYSGIEEAVEANYDVLCESKMKTDVWMVNRQRGEVWAKWILSGNLGCVGCYDGDSWVEYEGQLPGGGLIRVPWGYNIDIPVDMDAEGNVWALTDKGLCRLSRDDVWYETSRSNDLIPPILADDYGHIWVAKGSVLYEYPWTERYEGVTRYDIAARTWKDFTEREVAMCDWITCMKSAPNGDVWFCTWDGVTRYSQGPK